MESVIIKNICGVVTYCHETIEKVTSNVVIIQEYFSFMRKSDNIKIEKILILNFKVT